MHWKSYYKRKIQLAINIISIAFNCLFFLYRPFSLGLFNDANDLAKNKQKKCLLEN